AVLDGVQPGHGLPYHGMLRVETTRLERRQRRSPAVDVVHAPTAPPGAVPLLLADQVLEAGPEDVLVARDGPEGLESLRRDVLAGRVDHVAEVAEREHVEPVARVVRVEGAPAAVGRLHPGDPVEAAADGLVPHPELAQPAEGLVLETSAEGGHHDDRPHPGRLDPAPRAVRLLAVLHPCLRRFDGTATERPGTRRTPRL